MTPTSARLLRGDEVLRGGLRTLVRGAPAGPLTGMEYVVKDVIDVAGTRTGGGNPRWLAEQLPARRSASVVDMLTAAGATCVGKSHTDELAFSLAGANHHYGAPENPVVPGSAVGGSSSGSAAAVASGLVPMGIGTDTGGSVRVPASYCGIVGVRPTHGRVPTEGVLPLAPGLDTVGWLTRDADLARATGRTLLRGPGRSIVPRRLVLLTEPMGLVPAFVSEALRRRAGALAQRVGLTLGDAHAGLALDEAREVFRALQAAEAWRTHGEWIDRHRNDVSAEIRERFEAGRSLGAPDLTAARDFRRHVVSRIAHLWDDGSVLLAWPSAAGTAPDLRGTAAPEAHRLRLATLAMTCLGGLTGAPVMSVPGARVDGRPVGLSVMAVPGADESLLDTLASEHHL